MAGFGESFAAWWLHTAIGGGFLLLVAFALTLTSRQPALKQRLSECGLLAALLVAVLSFGPSWLPLPILPPSSLVSTAVSQAARYPEPSCQDKGNEMRPGQSSRAINSEDRKSVV